MENDPHYAGKSHWAGPATAIVLIAIVLLVMLWFEFGMMQTLTHG